MIEQVKAKLECWLAEYGLKLKPSKTSITHTLTSYEGKVGFDFLSFRFRQHTVSKYRARITRNGKSQPFSTLITPSREAQRKHLLKLKLTVRQYRSAPAKDLIHRLNPIIRGWTNYHRHVVSSKIFTRLDHYMVYQLIQWVKWQSRVKLHKSSKSVIGIFV